MEKLHISSLDPSRLSAPFHKIFQNDSLHLYNFDYMIDGTLV